MKLLRHAPRRGGFALAAMLSLFLGAGCSDRNPADLEMAKARVEPVVFDDDYSDDVYFQPFFETHYTAAELDSVYAYDGFAPDGARSLKITIPPQGSALGPYSGGVLTSGASRDLTGYDALTFYARSSVPIQLNTVGFGNDNTGTSRYPAGRGDERGFRISLTTEWTFYVVPIPGPSRLIAERGLFTFAEEAEIPEGYAIWFDEIRFAKVPGLAVDTPQLVPGNRGYFVGSTVNMSTRTVFDYDGELVVVWHSPRYFDYESTDPSVAAVIDELIRTVGEGEATITGSLEGTPAVGPGVNVTVYAPPETAAERPTLPSADVISLFSEAYDDVPVDSWRTDWSPVVEFEDYVVAGNAAKMYAALSYVGIDFQSAMLDISGMEALHLDVYAPAGTDFSVKPVSFPGGLTDYVEPAPVTRNAPDFEPGRWCSLEIPLSEFVFPEDWDPTHVGQLVLSTNTAKLVLVDNIYWHK